MIEVWELLEVVGLGRRPAGRIQQPPAPRAEPAKKPPVVDAKPAPAPSPRSDIPESPQPPSGGVVQTDTEGCTSQKKSLVFHASHLVPVPEAGAARVWGGNALEGQRTGSTELYGAGFLRALKVAKQRNIETMAYLEGPCGLTNGKNLDGELQRCAAKFAKTGGWLEYTFKQLRASVEHEIDHCEIDNVNEIPVDLWIAIMKHYKADYDQGRIRCKLILKNISSNNLKRIKKEFSTAREAAFISQIAIQESESNGGSIPGYSALLKGIQEIKGPGASMVASYNSTRYGSDFRNTSFESCVGKTLTTIRRNGLTGRSNDNPDRGNGVQ